MPTSQIIASRVVDQTLQEQFAELSGDRNPMHMDLVAARRTQAGAPVVHGVHTLLWALEAMMVTHTIVSSIQSVRARFLKWIYLGQQADLIVPDSSKDPASFIVEVQGIVALAVDLVYGEASPSLPGVQWVPSPEAPLIAAHDFGFEELKDRVGEAFTAHAASIQAMFPALCTAIGSSAVGDFAAASYVVGMEAPGLHSMFSKLQFTLHEKRSSQPRTALHYEVTYLDERFRKGRITVNGSGADGVLDVFVRIPPVKQASMDTIAAKVESDEFSGMNALIIGGSRGLGELTAKIIAAGGGSATITYALGKTEAEGVVSQINLWGGQASMLAYDVRKPPAAQVSDLLLPITHLFYFATNTIFKPKLHLVSAPVLADFAIFYLQGFYDLCVELMPKDITQPSDPRRLKAYYPSTTFVDERPAGMTEYAMTKAAGELMCRDMNQHMPGLHIIYTRLPRLPTDQTAGVLPERDSDPIEVLLLIVRAMKAAPGAG